MFLKMTKNHENHKLKMKNPGIHPINPRINQGYIDVGDKWMLAPSFGCWCPTFMFKDRGCW